MDKNTLEFQKTIKGRKLVISGFWGEVGWFLQRFASHLRYLKFNEYKDHAFVLFTDTHLHPFVNDFIFSTIDLPDEFYELGLDRDCYEAVEPNSDSGALTPPNVYSNLVEYMKEVCAYDEDRDELILPPRGCNFAMDKKPQTFCRFKVSPLIKTDRPIVTVFPRARVRASVRNVPEFVWFDVVSKLTQHFTVVLAGTPSGAGMAHVRGEHIINMISYDESDKTDKIIQYLNSSILSLSSQSGGTHISLLTHCPSYIIGHENERHTKTENRLNTPTCFRYVIDYRAIDSDTILNDVQEFITQLEGEHFYNTFRLNRPSLHRFRGRKGLVGVEIGVDRGLNSENILEFLDVEKLYLVDPYSLYRDLSNIGCNTNEEQCVDCKAEAHKRLKDYSDKVEWVEKLSEDAINDIPDDLDFVYVDGNHRYEYVKRDIELYLPKLKDGGLMVFHDYDYHEVKKAVDEEFGERVEVSRCLDNYDRMEAWYVKPTAYHELLIKDKDVLESLIG